MGTEPQCLSPPAFPLWLSSNFSMLAFRRIHFLFHREKLPVEESDRGSDLFRSLPPAEEELVSMVVSSWLYTTWLYLSYAFIFKL